MTTQTSSYATSTATSSLKSSVLVTTSTGPVEWWKSAKVVTAQVDYWTPAGKQFLENARIEVIDRQAGGLLNLTPAVGFRRAWEGEVEEARSKGLAVTAYEGLFYTFCGDSVFKDGDIYRKLDYENVFGKYEGQVVKYPLRALYQSPYWSDYFPEKWRNPDGSVMVDPIEGGCARTLQNKLIEWIDWGMTFLSIHNPHYLDYVKKCFEIDVDTGFDGIQIDCMDGTAFAL